MLCHIYIHVQYALAGQSTPHQTSPGHSFLDHSFLSETKQSTEYRRSETAYARWHARMYDRRARHHMIWRSVARYGTRHSVCTVGCVLPSIFLGGFLFEVCGLTILIIHPFIERTDEAGARCFRVQTVICQNMILIALLIGSLEKILSERHLSSAQTHPGETLRFTLRINAFQILLILRHAVSQSQSGLSKACII